MSEQAPRPGEPGSPEWLEKFKDLETTPAQEQGIRPLSEGVEEEPDEGDSAAAGPDSPEK